MYIDIDIYIYIYKGRNPTLPQWTVDLMAGPAFACCEKFTALIQPAWPCARNGCSTNIKQLPLVTIGLISETK